MSSDFPSKPDSGLAPPQPVGLTEAVRCHRRPARVLHYFLCDLQVTAEASSDENNSLHPELQFYQFCCRPRLCVEKRPASKSGPGGGVLPDAGSGRKVCGFPWPWLLGTLCFQKLP